MRSSIATLTLVLILSGAAVSETYIVNPEGTGDFPTIQAAVDAASDGDLIELADGTFTGDGNRDIDYLTIIDEAGRPVESARLARVPARADHPSARELAGRPLARIIHEAPTADAHLLVLEREIGVWLLDVLQVRLRGQSPISRPRTASARPRYEPS